MAKGHQHSFLKLLGGEEEDVLVLSGNTYFQRKRFAPQDLGSEQDIGLYV